MFSSFSLTLDTRKTISSFLFFATFRQISGEFSFSLARCFHQSTNENMCECFFFCAAREVFPLEMKEEKKKIKNAKFCEKKDLKNFLNASEVGEREKDWGEISEKYF